ncbi:MAG: DUF2062 domain-containing protein [Methylococcales bacterium]
MRKIFSRYLPDNAALKNHPHLRRIKHLLEDPNLWHLNRRSVSKAFAIGLFSAWIPSLGQMFIAAVGAIWFRANLPISVVLVLITNPLTSAPLFYFAYLVGARVLRTPNPIESISFDLNEILSVLGEVWQPFLLGCLIVASVSAVAGYAAVRLYWRHFVIKRWKQRRAARKPRKRGTGPCS